eukprot:2939870-Prymnesium_polylepis.1
MSQSCPNHVREAAAAAAGVVPSKAIANHVPIMDLRAFVALSPLPVTQGMIQPIFCALHLIA